MYIIIAGAGIIGRQITHLLTQNNHDIVVIDKNPDTCNTVYAETGAMTINGDATDINILKKAGASKAEVIVCLMRTAADNISCALMAKSLGIPQIVARLREPQYEEAYKLAGINNIVRMTDLLANQILMEVEKPKVRKVITLGGGKADIYTVKIPAEAKSIGMSIKEIAESRSFPDECVFVGIYKETENDFLIPRGNYKIHESDEIFLSSKSQHIKQATDFLIKS